MTLDDILNLLRQRIKIEITLSLDDTLQGKYSAKCEACGATLGVYTHEDSAKRALRTHRQHCPKDEVLESFKRGLDELNRKG